MKHAVWSLTLDRICLSTPFIILPLLVILATGCASHDKRDTLYDTYDLYSHKVQVRDYSYIVEDLLTRSMKNRKIKHYSDFPDYFPVLSDLPSILVKQENHFELRDGNFGCLTLNGFDRFDRPAVIKMEFGREQERWKLDYVSVDYLESPAEFVNAAVCPKRRA